MIPSAPEQNPFQAPATQSGLPESWQQTPVEFSRWALFASCFGFASLLYFPAPLAIVFAVLTARDIHRNPQKRGMGRAILGLVLGTLGSLGLVMILMNLLLGILLGNPVSR